VLAALEAHRAGGARALVVAWPAFAWWERAHRFAAHVRARHALVHRSPRLLVFALDAVPGGGGGLGAPRDGNILPVAGDPIQLTTQDDGALTRVEVSGELDVASGDALRGAVTEALDAGAQRVVLDLADVEFLDSAGLAAVLDIARTTHGRGREFSVTSPSGSEARLVIDLSGTGPMLGLDGTRS
jgi:anti-anti-sigma factor